MTVEQAALRYRMNADKLVEDLNKAMQISWWKILIKQYIRKNNVNVWLLYL